MYHYKKNRIGQNDSSKIVIYTRDLLEQFRIETDFKNMALFFCSICCLVVILSSHIV